MEMLKPNGFHLAVHYFPFSTNNFTKQKLAGRIPHLKKALELRGHLRDARVPEVEIQMVPLLVHDLMGDLEKQPFFNMEEPQHRDSLFRAALRLSRNPTIKPLFGKAGSELDLFTLFKNAFEKTKPPFQQEARHLIYSDSNLGMTETEKTRLNLLVTMLSKEASMVLVTGSEVGMCLNGAMELVHSAAPQLIQIAVEDCCNMNYRRGGMGMTFPFWSKITEYEHLSSPEKVRIFFGMVPGKAAPEPTKPIAWPKRI
ncbi:Uncharacterised protein [Candidatus Anstonella stagnisolia]|nr:Uncharacterised protein [Candidatus Anstonella stagnisolia]